MRDRTLARLRDYAADLYTDTNTANRVAKRLGDSKKPTQLEVSIAILKEFVTLNDTMTIMSDSIRAAVSYPAFKVRLKLHAGINLHRTGTLRQGR